VYYAIANASAWTLGPNRSPGRCAPARRHLVPGLGLAGCVVLAVALPVQAVVSGLGVLMLGALVYVVRRLR
jgi:APA family basic amino acid/polyamine antiporter